MGLAENTFVIYMGDNGTPEGESLLPGLEPTIDQLIMIHNSSYSYMNGDHTFANVAFRGLAPSGRLSLQNLLT